VAQEKKLFISWGGDDALEIATWLKDNIFIYVSGLKVYFSASAAPGTKWRIELEEKLNSASDGIGILTDAALARPWFLYEMSVLKNRLPRLPILRFGVELPDSHPLKDLQTLDGMDFANIVSIVDCLLEGQEDPAIRRTAMIAVGLKKDSWAGIVRTLGIRQKTMAALQRAMAGLNQTVATPEAFSALEENSCLREVATKTINDFEETFRGLARSERQNFRLDKRRYPEYLRHLQETLPCNTLAISNVNKPEEFWKAQIGSQVLESTRDDSKRIFVFEDREVLQGYLNTLAQHRAKYEVFVMSKQRFLRAAAPHNVDGDFSVLTDMKTESAVTAYYENVSNKIRFDARPLVVAAHRAAFADIRTRAAEFPKAGDALAQGNYEEFVDKVFPQKPGVHHSTAIPIEDYNDHEEDHPFYRDMVRYMLSRFRHYANGSQEKLEVLEIGAGTGHFTKRLPQQGLPVQVTALEPDPDAFKLLKRKFLRGSTPVRVEERNALDLEYHLAFDFVFSCFSEHHIQRQDKARYFSRILAALKPGGAFIVGDEFLPAHDLTDSQDYERALQAYHQFIIDEALKEHLLALAELEKAAWRSGMTNAETRVDYKTTLESYLQDARHAKFAVRETRCISPEAVAPKVGGMYVVVLQKSE
jgi:SAM-dependent methyltransferase